MSVQPQTKIAIDRFTPQFLAKAVRYRKKRNQRGMILHWEDDQLASFEFIIQS